MVEGLSQFLDDVKRSENFKGTQISSSLHMSHLLFVDDIIYFIDGSRWDINKLCSGLDLFKRDLGMQQFTKVFDYKIKLGRGRVIK